MPIHRTEDEWAALLGEDLRLDYQLAAGFFEDADLGSESTTASRMRDLVRARGIDNLVQAVANRIKTHRGELAALGHPRYGSRHHELLGHPNVDRTRALIKLYVLQALRDEPRVQVRRAVVRAEHEPPRETVRIELELEVVGEPTPLNLVIPFSLEASA